MNRRMTSGVCLAFWLSNPCLAQIPTPEPTDPPPAQVQSASLSSESHDAGFWPSERLTRSLIQRWAQQIGQHYDLRPDQFREVESHLTGRWSSFLTKNRSELQPLLNQYVEIRMAVSPPTPEQVSEWSTRALPVFERLRNHVEAGQQQFRTMLTASQQAKFDQDRTKVALGLGLFESKLRQWSVGNFELGEWWDETPQYRRQRVQRERMQNELTTRDGSNDLQARIDQYPKRVATELNAWQAHVANFCDTYQLDRSQRNAAQSILREMLDRADNHVRQNRQRILAVERIIEGNEQVDQPEVDAELEAVYGPIDAMFAELDERIHRLPTDAQLRRVGLEQAYDGASSARSSSLPTKPVVTEPTPMPTITTNPPGDESNPSP